MAGRIILGTANPSLDGNGKPVAGSTLTFYLNGTTTLQTIFSAVDLNTPLPNPLPCDASGEFPQIWAPDSAGYSVKWSRPGEADVTFDDIYPVSLPNNNFYRLVDVVATSNLLVASQLANGQTIDGQLLSTGMRVLLTAQTDGTENGIYDVPVSGAASRSADSNSTTSIPNGTLVTVQRGTVFKDTIWLHTTPVGFVLGTTPLTFQNKAGLQTRTILTTASASPYSPPVGRTQLRIRMVGGAGGGGGSGASDGGNGVAGTDTVFNAIHAKAGAGATGAANIGGLGGTGGTGAASLRIAGQNGGSGTLAPSGTVFPGARGGSSMLGLGADGTYSSTGMSAPANSGAGGSGAGGTSGNVSGGGGGGGEYVEIIINAPTGTYAFSVGPGGAGGIAGTSGNAGGAAGSGIIIIEEIH